MTRNLAAAIDVYTPEESERLLALLPVAPRCVPSSFLIDLFLLEPTELEDYDDEVTGVHGLKALFPFEPGDAVSSLGGRVYAGSDPPTAAESRYVARLRDGVWLDADPACYPDETYEHKASHIREPGAGEGANVAFSTVWFRVQSASGVVERVPAVIGVATRRIEAGQELLGWFADVPGRALAKRRIVIKE